MIAVDGPSGTGKGTLALRLAEWLGWHLLDSGLLYRLVGLAAFRRGVAMNDGAALAGLAHELAAEFSPAAGRLGVLLDGEDVSRAIRSEEAGGAASLVAAIPAVRTALLARQRAFRAPPGLVADGRDMGTVVFPDAALKIFLTASAEARARRRYNQLKEKGIDVNLQTLLEDICNRDRRDERRSVAPLKPASDATILDTTELGIDDVVDHVKRLIRERGLG